MYVDEEKIALHVNRIRRALESRDMDADEQEIRKLFIMNAIEYGLGEWKAEEKVLEHYGISPDSDEPVKLSQLSPGIRATVKGRVITINTAPVVRDGEEYLRYYGLIKDDTDTVSFNGWNSAQLEGIQKGDDIVIRGAMIEEWNGKPQIRIVRGATVEKTELDFEIPSGGGGRGPAESVRLSEVKPGMYIAFTARILSMEERRISSRGEEKTIYSGLLSDGSAKMPFTAWNDLGISAGDVIEVEGAYVKEWKGAPQINLDDRMKVEIVHTDFPEIDELDRGTPMKVWEAEERGNVIDAVLTVTVIDVKPGSGLIFRCPECRWVLQDGVCKKHGRVEGVPDLRIKAVLDDGTGALNMVAGKEITSRILGKSVEECVREAQEKMDRAVIFREIEERILARDFVVRGNVLTDEMSSTMIARDMEPVEADPVAEAEALIEEWGV